MPSNTNRIIFSVPTSGGGATPAATFSFYTAGYRPARQPRSKTRDIVHNQNGVFIYPYDNGPNRYQWDQFEIVLSEAFKAELGNSDTQWAQLRFLWQYMDGPMGFSAPDGVYSVGWGDNASMERQFKRYPASAGDKINEYRVVIEIEEE